MVEDEDSSFLYKSLGNVKTIIKDVGLIKLKEEIYV